MSGASTSAKHESAGERLLSQVQHVADVSDRWFLSAVEGFRHAGHWVHREVGIIGSSAKAAWQTTLQVTRSHMLAGEEGAASRAAPRATYRRGWAGLDVLPATPGTVLRERRSLPGPSAQRPTRRALVLRTLGEVVSEYRTRGYEALEHDARFWTLIRLLHDAHPGGDGTLHQDRNGRRSQGGTE